MTLGNFAIAIIVMAAAALSKVCENAYADKRETFESTQ